MTLAERKDATEVLAPDRFGLIIGAMKCGTTSLFNYLASHPEVAACRTKEPNYFNRESYDPNDPEAYYSLWSWQPGIHKIAVEASVNYTKIPTDHNCAERIARLPDVDVRFIYCMRNPIDRIESHAYHGLYRGWTRPIDEGVSEHALNVSRYAMQLDAYAAVFGKEKVFLLVLEEFEKAPADWLRQICEFLGIDSSYRFSGLGRAHNESSSHYFEHPLWRRIRRLEPLRRVTHLLPARIRRSVLSATGRRIQSRMRLTPAERTEVAAALRSDLARLRSEYGIDVERLWGIGVS